MNESVAQWLIKSEKLLLAANITTARLDCLVLLEDTLHKDRASILANQNDITLSALQKQRLSKQIARRVKHEPLAYIRGKTEFYGYEFLVSKDTLEPRPESEMILDILKTLPKPKTGGSLVDVGTGSGAIAICAKLLFPSLSVEATEISRSAITIALKNVERHDVEVAIHEGDLLLPVEAEPTIIVANLPYVPNGHTINEAAMQEPALAIFGGPDGLDLYREMFKQITGKHWQPSFILTESLPPQHTKLAVIAKKHGFQQTKESDFIQLFEPSTD